MNRLVVQTASKINLDLRITGRRADGFHDLRTLFQTIDFGDTIEIEAASHLELIVDENSIPADQTNIVWKAAEALQREIGRPAGARLTLRKRVPAGGGLGGGSGDGAAALLALNEFWKSNVSPDRLHEIGSELGSDVPFFLVGGRAQGRGRGEILQAEPDGEDEEFLLLIPGGALLTAEVYRDFAAHEGAGLTKSEAASNIAALHGFHVLASVRSRNDLEPAVFRLRPDLELLKGRLFELGASEALVSGSGVCLFARFSTRRVPSIADEGWPEDVKAKRCRFLSRLEYRKRLGIGSHGDFSS